MGPRYDWQRKNNRKKVSSAARTQIVGRSGSNGARMVAKR
jgi:hypothetical protein